MTTSRPGAAAPGSAGADPESHLVLSVDGSQIAVRSFLGGEMTPVLLVNAVGATVRMWRKPLAALAETRSWVTWDLRGLHDSPTPINDRADPAIHAADAIAALDHLGIEMVAVVSWSNGSRIAFELAAHHADRVRALTVVNGGYGQSLASLVRNLEPAGALPILAGIAKHFPSAAGTMFRQLVARPELAGLIRQSGLAGPTADTAVLIDMFRAMAECDTQRLLQTYEAVAGSSAADLLPTIRASTLVIAGGRDRISPHRIVDEMHAAIPAARVQVYEAATHYLPIEYPERLADDLGNFLSESDQALT